MPSVITLLLSGAAEVTAGSVYLYCNDVCGKNFLFSEYKKRAACKQRRLKVYQFN